MSDPGSTTGTIYIGCAGNADGVVLETGITGVSDGTIGIYLSAGVLTVDLYGNIGARQRKVKTIADDNWHFLGIGFDTSLAAANQLAMKVDNSTSGVTASQTDDLASQLMGGGVPNIGCRNAGIVPTNGYTGDMNTFLAFSIKHDDATMTQFWTYWQALMASIGISV